MDENIQRKEEDPIYLVYVAPTGPLGGLELILVLLMTIKRMENASATPTLNSSSGVPKLLDVIKKNENKFSRPPIGPGWCKRAAQAR